MDLALAVQRGVLPSLNNRTEPAEMMERMVERGDLGFKSGRGIYDWTQKSMPKLVAQRDRFILEVLRSRKNR